MAYACRLTRMCESEVPWSQNYWLNIKYPFTWYCVIGVLPPPVARRYTAHLQFVPYPPAWHVRGLLVRPWVVPRGTSSIVPGSSGILHHCPAPSTECFPDPVVSNYFIRRLPQFSQTAVKWRSPPLTIGPPESTDEAETCLITSLRNALVRDCA